MICLSCYHFATQLGSTHENGAVRDWTAPRINPTRLPMYFSPRYGAKTRSGSRCQSLAMPNGWCRMHGDLRPPLRRGIRSSARHGRRCCAACPVLALLRRADPAEWPLCRERTFTDCFAKKVITTRSPVQNIGKMRWRAASDAVSDIPAQIDEAMQQRCRYTSRAKSRRLPPSSPVAMPQGRSRKRWCELRARAWRHRRTRGLSIP